MKKSSLFLKLKSYFLSIFFLISKKSETRFLNEKNYFLIYLSSTFLITFFLILVFNLEKNTKLNRKILDSVLSYQVDYKKDPLEDKVFVLRPVLKEGVYSFPILSAQSVIALDIESDISLYEKNPDLFLLPASITKIVTALVAIDFFDENEALVFKGQKVDGQIMGLVGGEMIKVIDLINALLVYSANDAAYLLAENYPGGVRGFVLAMNEKAKELGAVSTNFENPTGFDGGNHKTTARDLVKITKSALQNPVIASIVKKKEVVISSIDGQIVHKLVNTNKLLGEVDGVLGVKTGWTENARENLITYYEKDGLRLLIVLLGSQDRFNETRQLIDWIKSSYDWLWVEAN